jgi:hypothetical protein
LKRIYFNLIYTSGSGNSDRSISEDLALKRPMNYGQGKEQVDEKDKKELSSLVNEAIGLLIKKYQPKTEIDLLNLKSI